MTCLKHFYAVVYTISLIVLWDILCVCEVCVNVCECACRESVSALTILATSSSLLIPNESVLRSHIVTHIP